MQLSQVSATNLNREAQLKALASQHNERCVQISQLEDQLSQQREHQERLQSHHDARVAQMQSELEALSKQHSDLQAASAANLQKSRSDAASLSAQMFSLRRQHTNMHSQSSTAAADLALARANETDLNEQLASARGEGLAHAEKAEMLARQLQALGSDHHAQQVLLHGLRMRL